MLEIVILIMGGRKIHEVAKTRGLMGWPFIILFVLMWFGGEFIGAIVGAFLFEDGAAAGGGFNCGAYMFALLGAAIGGGLGFGIGVGVPAAIGGDPTDDRRKRRGDMLDPDSSFDLPTSRRRESDKPRDESTPLPPHADDEKRNETGFRPYPDH